MTPTVLTIAGSDSGGGAGIQADLKTFEALGIHGTSAITCITAQNPKEVTAVEPVSPDLVSAQIRTVASEFSVTAVKTGMLYSSEIIETVADSVGACEFGIIVVDPVMVATSGAALLKDDAVESLKDRILPLATVITPNLQEAGVLCGAIPASVDEMKDSARTISSLYHTACVVKGGHAVQDEPGKAVDVLCADGKVAVFESPRVDVPDMHGTGCTFSAALAAFMAKGALLTDAVGKAKDFVTASLQNAVTTGTHHVLGWRS